MIFEIKESNIHAGFSDGLGSGLPVLSVVSVGKDVNDGYVTSYHLIE